MNSDVFIDYVSCTLIATNVKLGYRKFMIDELLKMRKKYCGGLSQH
jgi:hypothetical protein